MKNNIKARELTRIKIKTKEAIIYFDKGDMIGFDRMVKAIRSYENKGDEFLIASSKAICILMQHETRSNGFKDADEAWAHYHRTKEKTSGAATPEALELQTAKERSNS
jgi:hypothetical protein